MAQGSPQTVTNKMSLLPTNLNYTGNTYKYKLLAWKAPKLGKIPQSKAAKSFFTIIKVGYDKFRL